LEKDSGERRRFISPPTQFKFKAVKMKFVAILFAILPALALAGDESTTTCTSTTTMTKTITLTNESTTSVYAESTASSASTADAQKPTAAAAAPPAKSSPPTVAVAGASSMYSEYNLAALAGVGIAVAALL
jgi:hypothetical protein